MNGATITAVVLIAVILFFAVRYIYKEKKKGKACIGCPYADSCPKNRQSSKCSGEIPVKVSGEGEFLRVHPEYEKVSEAASKYGVAFRAVYDEVLTNTYRNDDIS